jgi:plasmid stabilization system protein ParE
MTLPLLFTPDAEGHLVKISDIYFGIREELGERFLRELNWTLWTIEEYPRASSRIFKQSRRRKIRQFPFHIYYRIKRDHVVVWAIFHTHRDLKPLKNIEKRS